ncbi:hypothetical protein HYZ97_02655 [Candidatus Pacearchaeota archaeon]|nr:hypothetical protein [Candidatus Pacearchaeota archaeon]
MPTFMENLAADPSGSGIYQSGQPAVLSLVNRLKDREMMDFKDKANFMSNLSIQQERARRLFDPQRQFEHEYNLAPQRPQGPEGPLIGQEGQQQQATRFAGSVRDPNVMTAFERGQLGIRQSELGVRQRRAGLEEQRIAQTGKLGEERLRIQSAQERLNQQKSDQINANKQADLERKINESNQKLELAQADLDRKTKAGEDTLQAHKAYQAAIEARHKLELDQKEHQFNVTSEQHDRQIKALETRIRQAGRTTTKTKISPEGTEKVTETRRGAAADTVQVTGKDGQTYEIPADKVDDWNANHAPEELVDTTPEGD